MSCSDWIICSVWTQDGQCPSEGTGEGVSELEVGALPRGDSAEVEMQSDALDAARRRLSVHIPG